MESVTITYAEAIRSAIDHALDTLPEVIVMGQLVDFSPGVFGTTKGLSEKYGSDRVFDFPISEGLMTSKAIGMALSGKRPVVVHQRLDFSLYATDALFNWISLWRFKSGGESNLPLTIRLIVGKGWGQGPQHSKSLYSMFGHLPGVRVGVPSNPIDAKGMLIDSIFGDVPTILIEPRALFEMKSPVPTGIFRTPFGRANLVSQGKRLTLVSFGSEFQLCRRIVDKLPTNSVDLIDLVSVKPLDIETVIHSVKKTRALLVVEGDWRTYGVAGEIISSTCEHLGTDLRHPPVRLTYPDSHTPASPRLETLFYISEEDVFTSALRLCSS